MLRVTVRHTGLQGAPYFSTHHFGGSTEAEADAAHSAVVEFWTDLNGVVSSSNFARVESDIPEVDPVNGQVREVFSESEVLIPFSASAEILPYAVQGLIRWRTGVFLGGREIRGRTFVPGPNVGNSNLGRPESAYQGTCNIAAAAFRAAGIPAGGLGVWARPRVTPARAGQFAVIQSNDTWGEWASLRSRRD